MDTSNRIQFYAAAGLTFAAIAILPMLYRAVRSDSESSLITLMVVSGLLTAVGVIVLATQLGSALGQFAKQPEREALYLSEVTAHDGGPFTGPGELDYVDDLPFVTPSPSLREQFAAAPLYANDELTSRHDDPFGEFSHLRDADGYLDLDNAAPCDLAAFYGHGSDEDPRNFAYACDGCGTDVSGHELDQHAGICKRCYAPDDYFVELEQHQLGSANEWVRRNFSTTAPSAQA